MIRYSLPTTVEVENIEYPINKKGDFRMILDCITVMNDPELSDDEKAFCVLSIFYNFNIPENTQSAYEAVRIFIDCGEDEKEEQPQKAPIMNWDKDFTIICDDINAKYGIDIRGLEYLHWWTFISYYKNLGEGQFSTIVSIRSKKQKGKKLEKWEQEFYQANRKKVDLDNPVLNSDEEEFFKSIFGDDSIDN